MILILLDQVKDQSMLHRRGFVPSIGGTQRLDREGLQNGQVSDQDLRIQYIKLHGSIDWWRDNNNNIFQNFSGNTPVVRLTERSIIYPIYEKHISAEPFFTFYQYFRRRLLHENIVVVIGYSFADPSINNAFVDWLTFNTNARIIIVARDNYQERIREVFGNQSRRTEFMRQYFGENGFINDLTRLLTNSVVTRP